MRHLGMNQEQQRMHKDVDPRTFNVAENKHSGIAYITPVKLRKMKLRRALYTIPT